MLLLSEWGRIELFPAVPEDWENAEFENLRAFGGLLISAKMIDGKISRAKISATADCDFELKNDLSRLSCNMNIVDKKHIKLKSGETLIFE